MTVSSNFLDNDVDYYVHAVDDEGLLSDPSATVNLLDAFGGGSARSGTLSQEKAAPFMAKSTVPQFQLRAPSPNPARSAATVAFDLPRSSDVRLAVFDVTGREVRRLVVGTRPTGSHEVRLSLTDLPGGLYLVRLVAGDDTATRRIVIAR